VQLTLGFDDEKRQLDSDMRSWRSRLAPECPIPPELERPQSDSGETLRPDFAVREFDPQPGRPAWQLLVSIVEPGRDLDRVDRGWRWRSSGSSIPGPSMRRRPWVIATRSSWQFSRT
jgi:hypothetical protein